MRVSFPSAEIACCACIEALRTAAAAAGDGARKSRAEAVGSAAHEMIRWRKSSAPAIVAAVLWRLVDEATPLDAGSWAVALALLAAIIAMSVTAAASSFGCTPPPPPPPAVLVVSMAALLPPPLVSTRTHPSAAGSAAARHAPPRAKTMAERKSAQCRRQCVNVCFFLCHKAITSSSNPSSSESESLRSSTSAVDAPSSPMTLMPRHARKQPPTAPAAAAPMKT